MPPSELDSVPRAGFDCIICGAGLVGTAAAIALGRLGLMVAVIDPRPLGVTSATAEPARRDERGLALAPSSQRILAELGLWSGLAAQVIPLHHIHVSDAGHFGFTRFHHTDVGLDALGYVCPAERLIASLEQALQAATTCKVFRDTQVSAIRSEAERMIVTVSGASETLELETGLLIGADGVRSPVREHCGIGTQTRDYEQTAIIANVTVSNPVANTAYERFTADGPVAVLPVSGVRHVVVRTARTAVAPALLALPDTAYLADLQARFGQRLGRFSALGTRTAHALLLARAEAITAPRCVLIGNAANSLHPNAAQGLNLGLRDVAFLTARIAAARRRALAIGADTVLKDYRAGREQDHRRVVAFTDSLAQVFASQLMPLVQLRSVGMLALDLIPPLKRQVMKRLMGLAEPRTPLLSVWTA